MSQSTHCEISDRATNPDGWMEIPGGHVDWDEATHNSWRFELTSLAQGGWRATHRREGQNIIAKKRR